jgi:DNA-binding MarR family transcriptional regulator
MNPLRVLYENEVKIDPNNYQLWRLFFIAQASMSRVRDLELAAIGVTPEQSGALFLLAARGKSTIGEMANAWCRQRNSVSTLMERMAKQGLVTKVKLPGQRDIEINITPKGREMHKRVLEDSGQVFDTIFSQFSDPERQGFAYCLKKVLSRSRSILEDDNENIPMDNETES